MKQITDTHIHDVIVGEEVEFVDLFFSTSKNGNERLKKFVSVQNLQDLYKDRIEVSVYNSSPDLPY